jgi:DNA-binding YbaB/EbfC family protein
MQHQLMNAQQELADAEVEGTAGGGLVTATVNGQGELVDLTISAAAVDVTDPAEAAQAVADLVLAAVRDAYRAAGELQQEKMGPLAALGGGGPGEVPGLSEFFGGAGSGDTGSEGGAPTGGAAPAGGTAPASGTALGGGATPGGDEPEGTVRD